MTSQLCYADFDSHSFSPLTFQWSLVRPTKHRNSITMRSQAIPKRKPYFRTCQAQSYRHASNLPCYRPTLLIPGRSVPFIFGDLPPSI
uniref:Uncharacterized protein n=1 Tax=Picea glauca TaxID=3330 RepID=A0A101M5I7_PICGL|nr:hypothetical protein ABT39_MTgene1056 [Picea glauca]